MNLQPRPLPLDLTAAFSRFRAADPERLHFAAHSHAYWPDVTRDAQIAAWDDAARLVDQKWDHVLEDVWPEVARGIAHHLRLPDLATLVPAPNTHEFVNRLLSALPVSRTPRVVTTDSEFHSFRRQAERLTEDRLIALTIVPAEPFATLAERMVETVRAENADLVFVSQVFFNSGFALGDLDALVTQLSYGDRLIVIDGYHGFLARPTDLSRIAGKAFYMAGGYKYAMAGEGCCFLHCPPGFAPRPRNTGWFASFAKLSSVQRGVPYSEDGWRFMGSTFDPSGLYRLRAMLGWLTAEGLDAAIIHAHVVALQQRFIAAMAQRSVGPFSADRLVVPLNETSRGNFLVFEDAQAAEWKDRLKAANIVTDVRGSRLRVGFGLYQNAQDVDRLTERLRSLG